MSSIPATQRFIKTGGSRSNASDRACDTVNSVREACVTTKSVKPQPTSSTKNAIVENPSIEITLPSMLVPKCSRCGRRSKAVEGAIFIGVTGKKKKQVGAGPLLLWKCGYCKKYEATSSTPACLIKRLFGVRKGGDFNISIERRPTYNSHGKITLERKRFFGLIEPIWYIGYVPVKSLRKAS